MTVTIRREEAVSGAGAASKKSSSVPRTGRKPRADVRAFSSDEFELITQGLREGHGITAAILLGEGDGKHLGSSEWAAVTRRGVRSTALDTLTVFLKVSQADFSSALDIPARTLARRKAEGVLNREESAKLVRVARVIERAEEVLESADAAREWLMRTNASLGGVTPFSLLDTEFGAETVMDTLGRIEHGVFA